MASSGTTNSLSEVSFAQDMFIASRRGRILTSLDGVHGQIVLQTHLSI